MAIGLAFITVLLRKEALAALDARQRWLVRQAFLWMPAWFREDDDLMATSFMAPGNVKQFCEGLEAATPLRRMRDVAVVDIQGLKGLHPEWLVWDLTRYGSGIASLQGRSWEWVDPLQERFPPSLLERIEGERAQAAKLGLPPPPQLSEEEQAWWGAPSEYFRVKGQGPDAGPDAVLGGERISLDYHPSWIPELFKELSG